MSFLGERYRDFPLNVRLLVVSRAARSIGQGITIASFTLYLHALGYGAAAIGAVLTAGLIFGAALTAIVGPLSDRRSRRSMLLAYEFTALLAALAALFSRNESVLITAATIAGFGRGANGAAGPFAPVEQAWIAREVAGVARRHALALNATVGFLGMAAGSALALVPGTFAHGVMTLGDYQLLFSIPVAASLFAIIVLAITDETASPHPSRPSHHPATPTP